MLGLTLAIRSTIVLLRVYAKSQTNFTPSAVFSRGQSLVNVDPDRFGTTTKRRKRRTRRKILGRRL